MLSLSLTSTRSVHRSLRYVALLAVVLLCSVYFLWQAEDGIRALVRSRGLGDVYKRQLCVLSGWVLLLSSLLAGPTASAQQADRSDPLRTSVVQVIAVRREAQARGALAADPGLDDEAQRLALIHV